jgi:arylsulfatase A-like enzyme
MKDTDYLTAVIAGLGIDIIKAAASGPFVIELATFAPHAPYTPAPQDANLFPNSKLPRTPAFGARPDANAPAWLQLVPQLKQAEIDQLESIYRKRMQAVQAVDRMLAGLRSTLDALALSDNTYLVFTSDNGYHLGDFSLRAGKQTAYDTDIHVPLIVVGPGVPKGKVVDAIVQNVDLCPTFRELSGAGDASEINGRSLVPFLRGHEPTDWRRAALVEHHGGNTDPTDPDGQDKFSTTASQSV